MKPYHRTGSRFAGAIGRPASGFCCMMKGDEVEVKVEVEVEVEVERGVMVVVMSVMSLMMVMLAGFLGVVQASAGIQHIYGDLVHTRYTVDEGFEVRGPVIMDMDRLRENRVRLQAGDTLLTEALRHLEAHTGWLLRQDPPSVTDKPETRAPVTPNDYVSQGLYWWPDPSKRDGLPYIRRDGQRNPAYDSLDFPRLGRLISAVESLALAWYFTGNELYAEKANHYLQVWFCAPETRMHPRLTYSQGIPGRNLGRASGLIDTYRMPVLIDAVYLLREGGSWPAHMDQCLQLWFSDLLDWMLTHDHGREEAAARNNHGTWYDAQVVSYAVFTGRAELAEGILREIVPRRIRSQVARSGRMPREMRRASGLAYSVYNLQAFSILVQYGRLFGLDLTEYRKWLSSGLPGAVAWLDREFERRPEGEHVRERRDWMFLRAELTGEAVEVTPGQVKELVPIKFRDVLILSSDIK
ncbi:MAG: alginate lyase family protein [Cyclonatronaceae bacterium]